MIPAVCKLSKFLLFSGDISPLTPISADECEKGTTGISACRALDWYAQYVLIR